MKQAEAEVVPSSSLVEVEVEVGVGGVMVGVGLTFSVGWVGGVGGCVVGDLESKANLNSSCSCNILQCPYYYTILSIL